MSGNILMITRFLIIYRYLNYVLKVNKCFLIHNVNLHKTVYTDISCKTMILFKLTNVNHRDTSKKNSIHWTIMEKKYEYRQIFWQVFVNSIKANDRDIIYHLLCRVRKLLCNGFENVIRGVS